MKIQGLDVFPDKLTKAPERQLLSAITIEQKREKHGKPGVLIGTRIRLHLQLIKHYLPELNEYINKAISANQM